MAYPALGDATITIPSADLQNIVLSALGKAGVVDTPTINSDGTVSTTRINFGGMSLTNWALLGVAAYFILRK